MGTLYSSRIVMDDITPLAKNACLKSTRQTSSLLTAVLDHSKMQYALALVLLQRE